MSNSPTAVLGTAAEASKRTRAQAEGTVLAVENGSDEFFNLLAHRHSQYHHGKDGKCF